MLTDFQNSFTVGLSSKREMKWSYPTTPQMRRYTTSWNGNVRKLQKYETKILFNYKF